MKSGNSLVKVVCMQRDWTYDDLVEFFEMVEDMVKEMDPTRDLLPPVPFDLDEDFPEIPRLPDPSTPEYKIWLSDNTVDPQ